MNIIIARKPLEGNCVANVLKHGTGGICIDKCRVAGAKPSVPQPTSKKTGNLYGFKNGKGISGEMSDSSQGRFPANIIHDGNVDELFPIGHARGNTTEETRTDKNGIFDSKWNLGEKNFNGGYDSGNASRFFYNIGEKK